MSSINITNNKNCLEVEQLLKSSLYGFITWFQIIILFFIYSFSALLFRQCIKSKIPLHSNLTILIFNVLIFYLINAFFWAVLLIRYKILFYTSIDNCSLLTPVWLVIALLVPGHFYLIANTFTHFLIMLERVRATLFVKYYEKEGIKFAVIGIIIVWILSLIYTVYLICSALADTETFGQPMGLLFITSKYNVSIILYSFYITLFISLLITICDFFVYWTNKNIKKGNKNIIPVSYSLSANYQLRENIFSMNMILPLDATYTICNAIYMIGCAILRIYRSQMSDVQYIGLYYVFITFPLLHSAITLFIYIYFVKRIKEKRILKIQPLDNSAQIYFGQLKKQWDVK